MKILVTVPFQKEHQEELKKEAPDALFFFKDAYTIDDKRDEKLYHAFLKEADIIIGNPSIEEIASAPKLKFVQSSNAGVEKYTQQPGFPRNVMLCSMSGAFGGIISEYVLGGILTMYRKFPSYIEHQQNVCGRMQEVSRH